MTIPVHTCVAAALAAMLLTGCGSEQTASAVEAASGMQSVGADLPVIPPEDVKKSQSGSVFQRVANTDIEVVYDRPVARGRDLFGGIVAFDEIWNPGANDATAVSFSRDVTINGEPLAAGKYSIWAIPRTGDWTLIFSRAADVYHEPYPGKDQDALRLNIAPQRGDYVETLVYYFPMVEGKETELRLHWGETVVPMMITVH
jgi:hypothetical protein